MRLGKPAAAEEAEGRAGGSAEDKNKPGGTSARTRTKASTCGCGCIYT